MRLLLRDLPPARIPEIEANMAPGAASDSGFLAHGERLAEIIRRDEATCAAHGITPEQIGDRLETLVARAIHDRVATYMRTKVGGADGVVVDGFRVTSAQFMGGQSCPFPCGGGGAYSTADYRIENLTTGLALDFPGLIMHLARDHHFFEGSVPYRVDPAKAIEVLAIEPGVDYAPTYVTERAWVCTLASPTSYEATLAEWPGFDLRVDNARERFEVADGITIFWRGRTCVVIAEREHLIGERLVGDIKWCEELVRPGTYLYEPRTQRSIR